MKRKALGLWPCVAVLLIVSGCGHCKTYIDQAGDSKSQVTVTSFSLHFTQQEKEQNIKARLGAPFYDSLDPQDEKGDSFEYIPLMGEKFPSAGQAFSRAYEIQGKTGARRVEPMFEAQIPRDDDGTGNQKCDDPESQNDKWSIKQIRADKAWESIQALLGDEYKNREAWDIVIAHPDTGYTHHPENWQQINGRPIIDAAKGYDYCENDKIPEDQLIDGPLEFPGHGTGSASVIVSPEGCQLQGADKCINGIARGAQLIPLRVHTSVILFNQRNLARAIRDVAEGKVDGKPQLVSIAMGGFPSLALEKAVTRAEDNGVLIVAASGNYIGVVVWPARYPSVIAVAATNVCCVPWKFSSLGAAVTISAPGELVWRAQLNDRHEYLISRSDGTTFAAGNTAGAAALWMVRHRETLNRLRDQKKQYLVTEAFRYALKKSAWRPGAGNNPDGTYCNNSTWDDRYGEGILDAYRLLEEPLDFNEIEKIRAARQQYYELPLFSSLYPAEAGKRKSNDQIELDYRSLFGPSEKYKGVNLSEFSRFETEIMYHYTMNRELRQNIEALAQNQQKEKKEEIEHHARQALSKQDLSGELGKYIEK